jgi:hypothetical protein
VVHGIEHATAKVLTERGHRVLAGQTEEKLFKLWLRPPARSPGSVPLPTSEELRAACGVAIERVRSDPEYAIHARCGTSWAALFLLAMVCALVTTGLGLFTELRFTWLLGVMGAVVTLLACGARPLGAWLQRVATVSTGFKAVRVQRVLRGTAWRDMACYYVTVEVES